MCECNEENLNSFCNSFSNGNPMSIILLLILLIVLFPIAFPIFIYYVCCKKHKDVDQENQGSNTHSSEKIEIRENNNSSYKVELNKN